MRTLTVPAATAFAALLIAGAATSASAQTLSQRAAAAREAKEAKEAAEKAGPSATACANASANEEAACIKAYNASVKKDNANQGLIIAALNAGNAKVQAQDFDGAIADYQGGVTAAPGHPNLFELHNALANAYRGRATKTFNAAVGPGVSQLPPAVLTSVGSDLKTSLEESDKAAAMAGTDATKLEKVGANMRETARIWAGADRVGVAATARPTLDTEKRLFDTWAATATPQQLTQYTPGIAFAMIPKDKAAAVALATTMYDKQPADIDTLVAYAQIVAEAKLAPTDPARVKAKAAVENALANATTNDSQKVRLRNARIKLNSTT